MRAVFRRLAGSAAVFCAACAGCGPSQVYFRPEGMNVLSAGAEVGRRFYVPPEAGKDGCEVTVTTDGARVVRKQTREKVAAVRVRLGITNKLGEPVGVPSNAFELVDSRGVKYPASYVAPSGVGEGGEVGPGSQATIDVYFDLGPPEMLNVLAAFTVKLSCSTGGKEYPFESRFLRYEPVRYCYGDPWCGPWYDPWPFWWGGAIIIHHRHSGSSGIWGP